MGLKDKIKGAIKLGKVDPKKRKGLICWVDSDGTVWGKPPKHGKPKKSKGKTKNKSK